MSKTPKFDAALDAIFSTLVPHERTCNECKKAFQIEVGDIEFLKKLRVPPPTLCPRCRLQRRLSYRCNIKPVFHKKTCSAPGHKEKVISFFGEENPVLVYDDVFYRSDEWDPLSFGVDCDSQKSFFEQFLSFQKQIPRQTLNRDPQGIRSEYTFGGKGAKDCYYVAVPYQSENLQYGSGGLVSKDSLDFIDLDSSEWCYGTVRTERSYNCSFCIDVSDCLDSAFLYDARNSKDCFASTNLRNRQYVFLNEQLTKEEYLKRRGEIDLSSYAEVEKWKEVFANLCKEAIRKNLDIQKAENCEGNQIRSSRNCFSSFRIFRNGENLRYFIYGDALTDSMDVWGGVSLSGAYESSGLADVAGCLFSWIIRTGREVEYSAECTNVEYCFGCFGLKNKKFCIFNVQYTEEEYWRRVDEIKTAMLARGEYGEFLPIEKSPHPYNESNAAIEFPMSKEEVIGRGLVWRDTDQVSSDFSGVDAIYAKDLPDTSADTSDDILKKVIVCIETGRAFRLTQYELAFYKKQKLPIPRLHPDVRIDRLLALRCPYRLWDDTCKKCGKFMKSGYDPKENFKVFCETCYQAEIV